VTTVRSEAKAQKIKDAHPNVPKSKLDFAIVPDIAQEGAFDEAVKSDPPFEAVLHTASPFHFKITDIKKELLEPAVIGTTGILKAIKKCAPTVKRVVITSSFAAIINTELGNGVGHTYSEKDWNPITEEGALKDPASGYRASKTFAEKAAWAFVEKEKPNFTLATINPPLVFGPIVHYLNSLDALNTSNERIRDFIQGKYKDGLPPTGVYLWVDVRDVALAHVKALEVEEAANKRFFVVAGTFSNNEIANIIKKYFPDLASKLPEQDTEAAGYPKGGFYGVDNSQSKKILGINYISLEKTIVDTVKSLQAVGA